MHYYPLNMGPAMIRLYRKVSTNQTYNYSGFTTGIDVYGDDVLFFNWNTPYAMYPSLLSQPLRCQCIVDYPKTFGIQSVDQINVLGNKPSKLEWDLQGDWARYGSMLLLNSSQGAEMPTEHLREHGVMHSHYVGDLTDTNEWTYLYHEHTELDWAWFNGRFHPWERIAGLVAPLGQLVRVGYSTDGYPQFLAWYDGRPGAYDLGCDGFALTKSILANTEPHHYTSFANGTVAEYFDFEGDAIQTGNHFHYDISYTFRKKDPSTDPVTYSDFRVNLRFFLEFKETFGSSNDDWSFVSPDAVAFADFSSVTPIGSGGPTGPRIQSIGQGLVVNSSYGTMLLTQPLQADSAGTEPNFYTFRRQGHPLDINYAHNFLQQGVEAMMWQLRPSSFLSSADALDKQMTAFSGNLLQNLQHLKEITDLIPDPAGFERLIAKAIKGDPSAIKEAIDLLTEYILRYRFQIAPLLRDVDKLTKLELSQVERVAKPQILTGYGQYRYTFLDTENFMNDGTLKLVTRSKIRFISDPSTLWGQMLMANSVGLLPTLSRIWNLLPFSFVVDWFTNMSKRLHLVDDQVLWLALRVVFCTHSYQVTYYPSDERLLEFNLKNAPGGEPFGVSTYIREFTRITPRLVDSPIDFLRPTKGPDPVTVGSLLWQLLS